MLHVKFKGLLAAGLVAAALAAMVAASPNAAPSRHTSNPFTIGCFNELDPNADATIVSFLGKGGLDAQAICLNEWRDYQDRVVTDPLVTCVVPGGGTGVFPNPNRLSQDDACSSIGAFVPAEGTPYGGLSAKQVRELDQEIAARYEATWNPSGPTCRSASVLRGAAEQGIRAYRADGWTVVDHTTESGQQCAHFTIDAPAGQVLIVDGDL